jgi:hypothetical protein
MGVVVAIEAGKGVWVLWVRLKPKALWMNFSCPQSVLMNYLERAKSTVLIFTALNDPDLRSKMG